MYQFIWDLDDDPEGNSYHIAEHGVTKEDAEAVVENPLGMETSRSSGRPIYFGYTSEGRLLAVVVELVDEETVYPVTAYFPDESP